MERELAGDEGGSVGHLFWPGGGASRCLDLPCCGPELHHLIRWRPHCFFFGLDFSKGLETHTRRKDRASIPEHQGFADMAPNNRIASIA